MSLQHPLLSVLLETWQGRPPGPDGQVTVLPPADGIEAVVSFTGHAVVATEFPAADVLAQQPDGFGAALGPAFLLWLARGHDVDGLDLLLCAAGTGVGSTLARRHDVAGKPRVRRALRQRSDVQVWGDDRGLVTLSRGLAGRRELSVEAAVPGRGQGRSLIREALGLVPAGEPIFVAVAPGNVRSLRVFLALGFAPMASEVQILAPSERRLS